MANGKGKPSRKGYMRSGPYEFKNFQELGDLLEDLSKEYGYKPNDVLDLVYDRYIRKSNPRYYWKLSRINLYLKQRLIDTQKAWVKFGKEHPGPLKLPFKKYKKLFYPYCKTGMKRIDSVRRVVNSAKYLEVKQRYFPDTQPMSKDQIRQEEINLNKLISDHRQDDAFNIKWHRDKKGNFSNQMVINLLR